MTGDRTQNTPRAGWPALHVAIDDHSRVGFSLLLADEKATSGHQAYPDPSLHGADHGKAERVHADLAAR